MQSVWIIEKKIDNQVAYFLGAESEFKGLKQALFEIVNEIVESWDIEDSNIAKNAEDIYNKSKSGNINLLREAVSLYNRCMYDHEWNVFRTEVQEPEAIQDLDVSFFHPNEDDEEVSEEEIESDIQVATNSNGATCRKCHNYNEYALSDTSDNTYECSQCKTFIQVFGSIN
jgi:hypothetical protein